MTTDNRMDHFRIHIIDESQVDGKFLRRSTVHEVGSAFMFKRRVDDSKKICKKQRKKNCIR